MGALIRNNLIQKQPLEVLKKKGGLRNFAKFTIKKNCTTVSFLIKMQIFLIKMPFLLKKRLVHMCFPVNFAKFLRKPFLQKTSGRLFLLIFEKDRQ